MTLINYNGSVGSGKTLHATASVIQDVIDSDIKDKPIYSNYKINHPNYHELLPETLLNAEMSGSNIVIDEAYIWLESRLSGKPINLYMSYILFQSRKRNMDIYLTDQILGSIDVRFRLLTDYEIKCKAIPNSKHPKGFVYYVIDRTGFRPRMYKNYLPIEAAAKYFDYYDTFELINPIDDELIAKISKSNKNIVKQVDEIVVDILGEYPYLKKFPKGIVADYCLNKDIPKSFVDKVYNSLLAKSARNI